MQQDKKKARAARDPVARAPVEETDADAVAKVRELLFGDAVRSIREEVLCNHSIVINRFEKLAAETDAKLERLGAKLASFNALFESAMAEQEEELRQLSEQTADEDAKLNASLAQLKKEAALQSDLAQLKEDAALKSELEQLTDAFCKTTGQLRKELHGRVNAQSAALLASEQRLLTQLKEHAQMLKASQVGKDDFATSLRSIAEQLSVPDRARPKPVAVGEN